MEISEFYAARLDEVEAVARATSRPAWREWYAEPWYDGEFLNDGRTVRSDLWGRTGAGAFTSQGAIPTVMADHITRHDPARVLREVEVKRAILAEHRTRVMLVPGLRGDAPQYWCETCHVPGDYPGSNWCATLRHLVAEFSDHPDYQESWKP